MAKRKIKAMHLQDHDIAALNYLFATKIATYHQLRRDIYPHLSEKTTGERMRKLANNKLVHITSNLVIQSGKRTVCLSKEGFKGYVAVGSELRTELSSDSPDHDLTLVDIRQRLLNCHETVEYLTENQIQTYHQDNAAIHSDAMIQLVRNGHEMLIPVEYERSSKATSRIISRIRNYYAHDPTVMAFYIADSWRHIAKIMALERSLFDWSRPKFFYCTLVDILETKPIVLKNNQEKSITLHPITPA